MESPLKLDSDTGGVDRLNCTYVAKLQRGPEAATGTAVFTFTTCTMFSFSALAGVVFQRSIP